MAKRLVTVITVEAGPRQTQNWRIDNTDFSNPQIALDKGLPLWKPKPNPDGPVSETPEPDDIERSRYLD